MASFGGETPINAQLVSTGGGSGVVRYTVPAGKYSRVTLQSVTGASANNQTYSFNIDGASGPVISSGTLNGALSSFINVSTTLHSGQTIVGLLGSGNATFNISVVEFNNP